jgi:hypothetical protein
LRSSTAESTSSLSSSFYQLYFPSYSSDDLSRDRTIRHPYHSFIRSSLQTTSLLLPLLLMSLVILFLVHFFSMRTCHNNFILEVLQDRFVFPSSSTSITFTSPCCLTEYSPYLLSIILIVLAIFCHYFFVFIFIMRSQFYLLLFCGLSFTIPFCFLFTHLIFHSCHSFHLPLDLFSYIFVLWNLFSAQRAWRQYL